MTPAVGDTATFWRRKRGSIRSQRVWVTVLEVDATGEWARVQLPSGNWPEVRVLPLTRLTRADPKEGW